MTYLSGSSYEGRWPLFSKTSNFAPGMALYMRHAVSGATFMSKRPVMTSTGKLNFGRAGVRSRSAMALSTALPVAGEKPMSCAFAR